MNWKLGIVLFFSTLLVIFVAQNYAVVEINFLFWTLKASRAIVLFLTLTAGFLMGWVLARFMTK